MQIKSAPNKKTSRTSSTVKRIKELQEITSNYGSTPPPKEWVELGKPTIKQALKHK